MEWLGVQQKRLGFVFGGRQVASRIVEVENRADASAAFKVLTTSPERYCVIPCCGVIQPKAVVKIEVKMRKFQGMFKAKNKCIDKFLIRSLLTQDDIDPCDFSLLRSKEGGRSLQDIKLEAWVDDPDIDAFDFGSILTTQSSGSIAFQPTENNATTFDDGALIRSREMISFVPIPVLSGVQDNDHPVENKELPKLEDIDQKSSKRDEQDIDRYRFLNRIPSDGIFGFVLGFVSGFLFGNFRSTS